MRIQLRRGSTAQWAAADPVLANGEPGVDLTADELRVGDGVNPWSALPAIGGGGGGGGTDATYPLAGYGLLAASGDPIDMMDDSLISTDTVRAARVWIPAGAAITNLWCAVRDAGSVDTASENRLGLYTDAGVLVAATADDATLWTAGGWRGGALVGGPVAAQGAGRFVYLMAIVGLTNGPRLPVVRGSSGELHSVWFNARAGGGANRRSFQNNPVTALPANFDPATYGNATTFVPLLGVS